MKKTHKKFDNLLVISLTGVCHEAIKCIDGFLWLTHLVNFDNFPKSLMIICVFDSKDNLAKARQLKNDQTLHTLIKTALVAANIQPIDVNRQVLFDTEEACLLEHAGDWKQRLSQN